MNRLLLAISRAARSWVPLTFLLATGCNSLFDIQEGTPRSICADELLIDDMEDGDEVICPTDGREGVWYAFGDGTVDATLNPRSDGPFTPTLIEEGARGTSRYAARLRGSGFKAWGAIMALDLSAESYDAAGIGGITFWMRSATPVTVAITSMETIPITDGGLCEEGCYDNFAFEITAPSQDWVPYQVPFNALRQLSGGSATWNPRHLKTITFTVPADVEFDVSVDDLSFYYCAGPECQPTCTDPELPVSCRAMDGPRSTCQPAGTDCAAAAEYLVMAEFSGGDRGCIGYPRDQTSSCSLNAPTGIPFAAIVYPLTDGVSNSRLRNPEPNRVCIKGTMVKNGSAAISFIVTRTRGGSEPTMSESYPLEVDPFDLQALDIRALEFTITDPPAGGVSLELRSVVKPECSAEYDCLGPIFSLAGPNARVVETKTVRAELAEFEPANPGPTLIWAFNFWGHSSSESSTNYDFCLSDVKFLDSVGALVTP